MLSRVLKVSISPEVKVPDEEVQEILQRQVPLSLSRAPSAKEVALWKKLTQKFPAEEALARLLSVYFENDVENSPVPFSKLTNSAGYKTFELGGAIQTIDSLDKLSEFFQEYFSEDEIDAIEDMLFLHSSQLFIFDVRIDKAEAFESMADTFLDLNLTLVECKFFSNHKYYRIDYESRKNNMVPNLYDFDKDDFDFCSRLPNSKLISGLKSGQGPFLRSLPDCSVKNIPKLHFNFRMARMGLMLSAGFLWWWQN